MNFKLKTARSMGMFIGLSALILFVPARSLNAQQIPADELPPPGTDTGLEGKYDPQSAAISSAYVSAFNDYVRKTLKFGQEKMYRPSAPLWKKWDFKHQPPGADRPLQQATNTMPDLATAMKYNPDLRIFLTGGYFDLATPFYEGWYEMHQLRIPERLQDHIEYHYYQSGHMVYAHQESLKALHDDAATFIHSTDHLDKGTH